MIIGKRRIPAWTLVGLFAIISMYSLANIYHWAVVWKFPAFYYFPQHSFQILDAETKEPLKDVTALYVYELDSIFSSSDWASHIFDSAGLHLYLPYQSLHNYVTNSRMQWNKSYAIHMTESFSNNNGTVVIESFGPVHRPRNHYFSNYHSPAAYLIKRGYHIESLQRSNVGGNTPWRYLPPWVNSQILLTQVSVSSNNPFILEPYQVLGRTQGAYDGRGNPETIIPTALRILKEIEAENTNE